MSRRLGRIGRIQWPDRPFPTTAQLPPRGPTDRSHQDFFCLNAGMDRQSLQTTAFPFVDSGNYDAENHIEFQFNVEKSADDFSPARKIARRPATGYDDP